MTVSQVLAHEGEGRHTRRRRRGDLPCGRPGCMCDVAPGRTAEVGPGTSRQWKTKVTSGEARCELVAGRAEKHGNALYVIYISELMPVLLFALTPVAVQRVYGTVIKAVGGVYPPRPRMPSLCPDFS